MAEEPEVKVVDFDDVALFDINGLRYELSLENSHLIQKVDERLAKIPAKKYDMKVFTITVPYLFEVPGLDKYLDVTLSIDCQPWDYKPDSHYVSTNLGIESARLRDKREDERVEAEKVVVAGDYEKREGLGDSYAIKQNGNWVVYGAHDVIDDDYFAAYLIIRLKIWMTLTSYQMTSRYTFQTLVKTISFRQEKLTSGTWSMSSLLKSRS